MLSHFTILVGDNPMLKEYTIDTTTNRARKGYVKTSYLHTTAVIEVNDLADLYEGISAVREIDNAYIVRGLKEEDTANTRRVLKCDEHPDGFIEVPTSWLCCDFDQYEVPKDVSRTSKEAINYLIENHLPPMFKNVSYIYQWSSSAGLEYNNEPIKPGTSVHLFFYLDKHVSYKEFEYWFDYQIKHDGFDPSTFRTITPIFVNSTVIKDPRIIDIINEEDKFGIVLKDTDSVNVPEIIAPAPQTFVSTTTIETTNKILLKLNEVGANYLKTGKWLRLWHNAENTKGNWFVALADPTVVHHHVKDSMSITRWLKEFWNADFELQNTQTRERSQQQIIRSSIR